MTRVAKPLRFLAVGLLNTGIDFGLLFALTAVGVPVIPANMISTLAALSFSFFANRSFTFGAQGNSLRQAWRFLVVTLFGLWALQPLVLLAGEWALQAVLEEPWRLAAAKVAATCVSLIWNYMTYDRFVFAPRPAVLTAEKTEPLRESDQESS